MIHDQEPWPPSDVPRFYAYCACGVCGPLRTRREHALADDNAHYTVCSSTNRRAA